MRRFLGFIILTLCSGVFVARAYDLHDESLEYRVMFKWGLIHKQAGTVTIDTRPDGKDYYTSELIGRSARWADHFFEVRDTLRGKIQASTDMPVYYEKIAREGGGYKHDVIRYSHEGDSVIGNCTRHAYDKKLKEVVETTRRHAATGFTVDILSAFYYMRGLDYGGMQPGEAVTCTIFSGTKKETLHITYRGMEPVEIDGRSVDCYYITFTFTSKNGKKSSDDMQAWISTDSRCVPLLMVGNLPVGSVRCYYSGTNY